MTVLRFTLLSDGSTDRTLIPILTWALKERGVTVAIDPQWADLGRLPKQPKSLAERIALASELYPCDLIFVHRDAERIAYASRRREIDEAISEAVKLTHHFPSATCVVPVRMTEAWLLFDEAAIRSAAGNPRGRRPLGLPHLDNLEKLPDPKRSLHDLLREASELTGRRRRQMNVRRAVHTVSERVNDFGPLRRLAAFSALERDLDAVVSTQGWS